MANIKADFGEKYFNICAVPNTKRGSLFAQLNHHSFARRFDFHSTLGLDDKAAGMFHERIHFFVVMIRVMVKEHQFFHARPERKRYRIIHTTMPPSPVFFIFGGVILRIQNQHVGIANEIKHVAVIAGPVQFRVREKNNDALRGEQPVAHRDAGMVGALGADEKAADGKIEIGQLLDVNVAGEL